MRIVPAICACVLVACGPAPALSLLHTAGVPITQTPRPSIPLEVVTRSTGVHDPLEVRGGGELYELDTEIGQNYYDEVVGPELRSAARGVFARHSCLELQKSDEKIEDEIETDLRRRIRGKHVDIGSITLEGVEYAPEILAANRARLVAEQEAARDKTRLESEALRKRLELASAAEQAKLEAEQELRGKEHERQMAVEQAAIDKTKAESDSQTRLTRAKAEAEATMLLAKAHSKELARAAQLLGFARLREREDLRDFDAQLAGVDHRRDRAELVGRRLHEDVPRADPVLLRVVFARVRDDGDEDSALLQYAPRALLRLAADEVEHDVDVARRVLEARFLVVDHFVGAERANVLDVVGRARADDARAAVAWSIDSGFFASVDSRTATSSAYPPSRAMSGRPKTSSPFEKRFALAPVATTTLETSHPGVIGSLYFTASFSIPSRTFQSTGFTPHTRTRTSTSSSPGTGSGASS